MTDKILVSRSEIEALQKYFQYGDGYLAIDTGINVGQFIKIDDLLALLDKAAISQVEPESVTPDFFQLDDGSEYWFECPDDAAIISELSNVKVDTEYDVWASHTYRQTYRVTKLPDEKDDDTEVELVSSQRSYYTSPPADKKDAERYRWLKRYARTILWFAKDEIIPKTGREELDDHIDAAMQKSDK